jgi:RNA polymerase sigma-70 factor (ECF subfamily)
MNQNDAEIEELIRRARDGDREALGMILERQRGPLRVMAQRKISGPLAARIDASDVVQQTCLSVYGNLGKFQGRTEGEFVAWLERIHEQNLQNVIRDHTQAQRRAVNREISLDAGETPASDRLQSETATPSQRVMRDEQTIKMFKVLERLPEDQRTVVQLRHLDGWSLAQISAHLGRSEQSIVGLLKRGMQGLRKFLQNENL